MEQDSDLGSARCLSACAALTGSWSVSSAEQNKESGLAELERGKHRRSRTSPIGPAGEILAGVRYRNRVGLAVLAGGIPPAGT